LNGLLTDPILWRDQRVLPFPALSGQEHVKQALLMLAVNPRLSGLLIRGEKGTGKSTAARGLARLLPRIQVHEGCPFGCAANHAPSWCPDCRSRTDPVLVEKPPPFETLPLGITEDRLLGTFDLERALQHGEKRFLPGLLAKVNGGILYVDELNLLDDPIVDLLLDCAASGVNCVEREGISMAHPAEFLLVGTMNPEEGEIRPQLEDRFGLCAGVQTITDPEARAEIIERCLSFEKDPASFRKTWAGEEANLRQRIVEARRLLPRIRPARKWLTAVAGISTRLGVHGHRADLLMIKAASTLAALDGRLELEGRDLETAATLVYPHRLRRVPFEENALGPSELREVVHQALGSLSGTPKKKSPALKRP
jgi:Mg-chelatase subunit ChlI